MGQGGIGRGNGGLLLVFALQAITNIIAKKCPRGVFSAMILVIRCKNPTIPEGAYSCEANETYFKSMIFKWSIFSPATIRT